MGAGSKEEVPGPLLSGQFAFLNSYARERPKLFVEIRVPRGKQNLIRKFLNGLVFGAGFAIAFLLVGWVVLGLLLPGTVTPGEPLPAFYGPSISFKELLEEPFSYLTLEAKTERSSVIALLRYEPSLDGKSMRAIFEDLLKKEPGTTFPYEVGDEFPKGRFYPEGETNHKEGMVVFLAGSPAAFRMSTTYSGDRIGGLENIPLELLRKKFNPSAQPRHTTK